MAKLSPALQIGLLDQLGVVDGSEFFRSTEGNPSTPDTIPPSGVGQTTKDTGSPQSFIDRFKTADTQTQALTAGGVLLAIFGLVFVARQVL